MIQEQDEADADEHESQRRGRPHNASLVDHGHNQISVGDDDPLLKRLQKLHANRRYWAKKTGA